jgi:O-antigen ligase
MRSDLPVMNATTLNKKTINLRLAIVCMAAASVGLSVALISIFKLLLLLGGMATLLFAQRARGHGESLTRTRVPLAVLATLFLFALSLLWTVAPQADALGALAKYGKLILILLMMALIQNRREAMYALAAFVAGQFFLLASSWMLFAHLPVPWATSDATLTEYAVFSSYIDQGIRNAVLAATCWHLRGLAPGRYGRHIAIFLATTSLFSVFFLLNGRTGHVVGIALLSIAIMWELPKKYRSFVVLLPFLLALALFFSSTKVRDRLTAVQTDLQSYSGQMQPETSSGIRIALWRRAIESIAQHPFAGAGVGSWLTESNRLQHEQRPESNSIDGYGNPHQEYLLWGVQLGIPGVVALLVLMLSLLAETRRMETQYARAAQSCLLALAVACLFNSSIYDSLIGEFFCVSIGLLLALGLSKTPATAIAAPLSKSPT